MGEAPATLFGKYELLERLGTGGMAVVYRARYTAAPGVIKPVVIKRVLAHYAEDPAFAAMFLNEARISIGLSHGNIVQVFDFGQVDGEYFLAMELVDGQPLSRVLKQARTQGLPSLPSPLAVGIAIEMCRGLHHAHERTDEQGHPLGLVHRDISPDNVLISYGGEVKISDFGIAKARLAGRPETDVGVVKGKYPYFSPEQARGQPLDARSDVYAVGVVLYQMLCGRRPAEGGELEVMQCIAEGRLAPLESLNEKLDSRLVAIVHQALATDLGVRFSTAEALQQALSDSMGLEAPLFRSTTRKHLMGWLFQEDLSATGRSARVPADFLRMVETWREVPTAPLRPMPREGVFTEAPRRQRLEMKPVVPPMQPGQVAQPVTGAFNPPRAAARSPPEQSSRVPWPAGLDEEVSSRRTPFTSSGSTSGVSVVLRAVAFGLGVGGLVTMGAFWWSVIRPDARPQVSIHSSPPGAYVLMDGAVRGRTPLKLDARTLKPQQRLALVNVGMKSWSRNFAISGDELQVDVKLEPLTEEVPSLSVPGSDGLLPPKQTERVLNEVARALPLHVGVKQGAPPLRPNAYVLWMVLDPEHTYRAWVPSTVSDYPLPGEDLRETEERLPVVAVLEGANVPRSAAIQVVESGAQTFPAAQVVYFLVLRHVEDASAARGMAVVNVQDTMTGEMVSMGLLR